MDKIILIVVLIFATIAFTMGSFSILTDLLEDNKKFKKYMDSHKTFLKVLRISLYIPVLHLIPGCILFIMACIDEIKEADEKIRNVYND